jgi:hypothetical protein
MRIAAAAMMLILATDCPFVCADDEDVTELQATEDDSDAIQAAWQAAKQTVPVDPGQGVHRPDKEKLVHFLDLLKERTRVTPPTWWREVVLDAQAYHREGFFRGKPKSDPYHADGPYHEDGLDSVWCPKGASVRQEGYSIVYHARDDSITIPGKLLTRDARSLVSCNISGVFTSKRFFVAVHDDWDYERQLSCVSRSSGNVLWTSEICGKRQGGSTGPPPPHSLATVMATDDGRVFVFGAGLTGFYAQGFRGNNGKSLIEFSSRSR